MKHSVVLFVVSLMCGSIGFAAGGSSNFGLNVGLGIPFLSQMGINYQANDSFGVALGYNVLDLTMGDSKAKLSMPELMFNYHPFAGSYFIGLGVGQESLETKSTSASTGNTASIKVDAMTGILKTGWMWGLANRGFWFGIDVSYILPSGAKQTITAPGVPTTDPAYIDAQDAAKKFGETSYTNITFARLGWLF